MATDMDAQAAATDWDYMFKLLIVGNSGVGKTALLFRYVENTFLDSFIATVGIDFKVKTVVRQGKTIKLQIWDTAGQERYKAITAAYFRGAMGFAMVFDVMNRESFNSVRNWCSDITSGRWEFAQMILIGNKTDLGEMDSRMVTVTEGESLAKELQIKYFETSAKDNRGVSEAFSGLVDGVLEKMLETIDKAVDGETGDEVIERARHTAPQVKMEDEKPSSCAC